MTNEAIKDAVARILRGERAKLVVTAANEQAARALLAQLPARIRTLLTIVVQ